MDRLAVPSELAPHLLAYASADLGFLHQCRSGRPPSPGVGTALVAHRVVDAAYRSAEMGGMPQSSWRRQDRSPGRGLSGATPGSLPVGACRGRGSHRPEQEP